MTYYRENTEYVAQFGPQRVYQRNNLLILECKSNLIPGGVIVRRDAYDWLSSYKDQYDCGVLLSNIPAGWSKLVSLTDLPVKESREGNDGAYWIIHRSDLGNFEPAPVEGEREEVPF